ncbi:MAG: hypothetical protein ABI167_03095 [Nitrosospira sp.]
MNKRVKSLPELSLAPVIEIFNPSFKEVDKGTVTMLRGLLRQAEAGQISGFVYVLIKPDGHYSVDISSLERNNATFITGVLEVFKASLLEKIFRRRIQK